ncbi:periplasmic protease [Nitzschia inconspicua]|uniref:Periplasmic protease n=1 Tax=Nitzschia inconspicua TaxID=303405 RepID=A0A9K3L7N3_9STRA|nr:periplasmic protease [Nitzschia inconspicua]
MPKVTSSRVRLGDRSSLRVIMILLVLSWSWMVSLKFSNSAAVVKAAALAPVSAGKKKGALADKNVKGGTNSNATIMDDTLIQDNPDYGGGNSDNDDDDDDDDQDANVSIRDRKQTQSRLSEALKKKYNANSLSKHFKRHRGVLIFALAAVAFRNELWTLVQYLIQKGAKNVSTTDILKLLLFVGFMRRLQSGDWTIEGDTSLGNASSSPMMSLLQAIFPSNPAYIPPLKQHFTFERINEQFVKDGMALKKALCSRHEGLKWPKSASSSFLKLSEWNSGTTSLTPQKSNETVILLDWTRLDTALTSMEQMRHQVAFLLSEYRSLAMNSKVDDKTTTTPPKLEVILLLESSGGSVAEYGLAGSLLLKLRETPGITLTICVDKVAASGGYMLCCTASPGQLFAAPFALVGSIGVIGQLLNVQDLLTGWGIQPLVFRGGKDKAPVGLIGEVTNEGKQTTQKMIDDTHDAFKRHVVRARPVLNKHLSKIGSGHVWLGVDALDLELIDQVKTSDEYIGEKVKEGARVLKMVVYRPHRFLLGPRYGDAGFEMRGFLSGIGKSFQSAVQHLGSHQFRMKTATEAISHC